MKTGAEFPKPKVKDSEESTKTETCAASLDRSRSSAPQSPGRVERLWTILNTPLCPIGHSPPRLDTGAPDLPSALEGYDATCLFDSHTRLSRMTKQANRVIPSRQPTYEIGTTITKPRMTRGLACVCASLQLQVRSDALMALQENNTISAWVPLLIQLQHVLQHEWKEASHESLSAHHSEVRFVKEITQPASSSYERTSSSGP